MDKKPVAEAVEQAVGQKQKPNANQIALNAMVRELTRQRNDANDKLANQAADLAVMGAALEELQGKVQSLTQALELAMKAAKQTPDTPEGKPASEGETVK